MSPGGTHIEITNINVMYISTKTDKFDNTICYFKVTGFALTVKVCCVLFYLNVVRNVEYQYG